jgi:hypothetical protein
MVFEEKASWGATHGLKARTLHLRTSILHGLQFELNLLQNFDGNADA